MLTVWIRGAAHDFHVGDPDIGFLPLWVNQGEPISRIQADGDELEQINRMGINTGELRVVNFYGDQAAFIAGNWPKKSL